jgi:hypothetical protein
MLKTGLGGGRSSVTPCGRAEELAGYRTFQLSWLQQPLTRNWGCRGPWSPAATQFSKSLAMEYPSGFPKQSRAAVEAEEIRASRGFDQARQELSWSANGPGEDLEVELIRYILRIYAVFVREICKLGCVWDLNRIRSHTREFLRMLTSKAWSEKGYDTGGRAYPGQMRRLPDMTSHVNGAILPGVYSLPMGNQRRHPARRGVCSARISSSAHELLLAFRQVTGPMGTEPHTMQLRPPPIVT